MIWLATRCPAYGPFSCLYFHDVLCCSDLRNLILSQFWPELVQVVFKSLLEGFRVVSDFHPREFFKANTTLKRHVFPKGVCFLPSACWTPVQGAYPEPCLILCWCLSHVPSLSGPFSSRASLLHCLTQGSKHCLQLLVDHLPVLDDDAVSESMNNVMNFKHLPGVLRLFAETCAFCIPGLLRFLRSGH